jgi:hypothetical protein
MNNEIKMFVEEVRCAFLENLVYYKISDRLSISDVREIIGAFERACKTVEDEQ